MKSKIKITSKAYLEIKKNSYKHWPNEWGGLLVVKDNIVTEIIKLGQESNGVYFQIHDDELADFMINIMEKDPEKLKYIKGWVHCHPIIGWSGTDNDTFKRLIQHFGDSCLGIVDQKAKTLRVRLDSRDGGIIKIEDDIDYDIIDDSKDYFDNTYKILLDTEGAK